MDDLGKRAERSLKRALFGLLLGRRGVNDGAVDLGGVHRVLVVRANFRMGNLLLVTPALAALRHGLPGARIDVVGPRGYLDLLEHSPDVDRRIAIDRRTLVVPWAFVRLVRQLRRQDYDLAIDGARGSSFLGAVLVALSGARRRVAAAGSRYEGLFDVRVRPDGTARHKVDLLLSLLAGIGIAPTTRAMTITVSDAERERAIARWRAMGVAPGTPAIAVNVGARGAKRAQPDRLAELVLALRKEHDVPIVLLAGPEDEERLSALRPQLPADVMVAPRMSIREFAAFLSRAAVLVTSDTGPMHLAAAVGVPTVALLVAPRSAFFAPRGHLDRTVFTGRAARIPAVLDAVRAALGRADVERHPEIA